MERSPTSDHMQTSQPEPGNLLPWMATKIPASTGRLYSCARPGRATYKRARVLVDNETIDKWARGLPEARPLHIVSLLGKKRDGFSEFEYYPFRSEKETAAKPSFQEWLDARYGSRFVVHEIPTVDAQPIPEDLLLQAARLVTMLTDAGGAVLVVDSAGSVRSSRICRAAGFTQRVRTAA